jgi:GNAT superfamily N-acetyltransferase
MSLLIEPLTRIHDRRSFSCGDETVDLFLREKAMQDQTLGLGRSRVLFDSEKPSEIIGYYTLVMCPVPQESIPNDKPRIKRPIPAILLGQIGIDLKFQGKGFGDRLLFDAQSKVFEIADRLGVRAMVLDARTGSLVSWYESNDFIKLPDSLRMVKHIDAIARLFV